MAKMCPITNSRVLYLDCLECEENLCKKRRNKDEKKDFGNDTCNDTFVDVLHNDVC